MESWSLADPEALADFYGQGFQTSALPSSDYVEGLAKRAVYTALEKAT